jgi:hypothetical protein
MTTADALTGLEAASEDDRLWFEAHPHPAVPPG